MINISQIFNKLFISEIDQIIGSKKRCFYKALYIIHLTEL